MIDVRADEDAAVLAVRVSKEIDGSQYDGSVPSVRSSGPEEAALALAAARAAHAGSRIDQIAFQSFEMEASYDCHGASLALALGADDYALDEASYEMVLVSPDPFPDAGLVQPIVRVRCAHAVDDRAAISVLGSLDSQLRELAEARFASLSDAVFLIEQP